MIHFSSKYFSYFRTAKRNLKCLFCLQNNHAVRQTDTITHSCRANVPSWSCECNVHTSICPTGNCGFRTTDCRFMLLLHERYRWVWSHLFRPAQLEQISICHESFLRTFTEILKTPNIDKYIQSAFCDIGFQALFFTCKRVKVALCLRKYLWNN